MSAQEATVRVEISGVGGAIEENVRQVLSLARAAENGSLPVARIRRLHGLAGAEIELALQPFGYYRPRIESGLRQVGDIWVARYAIAPGRPVLVRGVNLSLSGAGRDEPVFRRLVAGFPLQVGDTLRHAEYEVAKLGFLAVAADSGYLAAAFDTALIRVDRNAASAEIVLRFETGERFRFGAVTFNQSVLDPARLQSQVPFQPGELYRADKLLQLQTALAEQPYFSRVEVRPLVAEARDGEVPIAVDLVPARPQAYEVGVGYGTDTGPRGTAKIELRRLNRAGHRAEAELTASTVERSVSAQYMIPAVLSQAGLLTIFGGYANLDPTTSRSEAILAGARLSRPRGRWRETLSLAFRHESFEVGVDRGIADLLIGGGSWEYTAATNRIFPSRGQRIRFEAQGSPGGAVSSASFVQAKVSGKVIRSLGSRTRILTRAEVGRLFTGDFHQLPPTIRYFTGGDQSVRGYRYLDLGPRDGAGNVIGGRALVTASVELDHRVFERWSVATFYDAGNALDELALSLEQGAGAGIRWLSPIGLIRLDGAFAVSRTGSPFRIHFSIGPDL
ncbi:MAG: autotransporter assembly complex family protein [Gemmatimonadales bacterium]